MKSISHICSDTLVACMPHSSDEIVEKIRPEPVVARRIGEVERRVAAPGVRLDRTEPAVGAAGHRVEQRGAAVAAPASAASSPNQRVGGEELGDGRVEPAGAGVHQPGRRIAEQPGDAGPVPRQGRPRRRTRRRPARRAGARSPSTHASGRPVGSRWNVAASGPPSGPSTRPTHCSPSHRYDAMIATVGVDVDQPVAVDPDELVRRTAAVVAGDEPAEAVVRVLDGRRRRAVASPIAAPAGRTGRSGSVGSRSAPTRAVGPAAERVVASYSMRPVARRRPARPGDRSP